jgi:hypothetical protein
LSETVEQLKEERDRLNAEWLKANAIAKSTPEAIAAERLWGAYRVACLEYDAAQVREEGAAVSATATEKE